jgi:hypothetical protein
MYIALVLAGAYAGVLFAAFAWNAIVWTAQIAGGLLARKQAPHDDLSISPHIVVTLVHGTWARHAAWTLPSSRLCRTLCKEAQGPVRFERFLWSGWNTVTSRHRAVTRLIAQLAASQTRWPHARHFVIGHSHGGNIAFQAMRERSVAERIAGLACLSTPFLCASSTSGKDRFTTALLTSIKPRGGLISTSCRSSALRIRSTVRFCRRRCGAPCQRADKDGVINHWFRSDDVSVETSLHLLNAAPTVIRSAT